MPESNDHCLVCERTKDSIPLLRLEFKDQYLHICPEHLPILIHHPDQLIGKLPGAENLQPHTH